MDACRFCLEPSVRENLVAPCGCSGSQKYLHLACLKRWQLAARDERAETCNVCKMAFKYSLPTETVLRKLQRIFHDVIPTFFALMGVLALNHSNLFFGCISLIALLCMRTAAFAVILLVGIFSLLICFQMRGARPILFVDDNGRTRVALIRHGSPVDGLGAGMFLVATEAISNGAFRHSVILLLEHSMRGSRGVIVNSNVQPAPTVVPPYLSKLRARYGGPVAGHTLLHLFENVRGATTLQLHSSQARVFVDGSAREVLDRLETGAGEDAPQLFAGLAAWTAGQLDGEVRRGLWGWHPAHVPHIGLSTEADREALWRTLIASLELMQFQGDEDSAMVAQ